MHSFKVGEKKNHCMSGDGYHSEKPHTHHESFHGIDVDQLYQNNGKPGHNYNDNPHPFTEHELVVGLGINETMALVEKRIMDLAILEHFMNISEAARHYTQLHFKLHNLYFDFTHLVCRTSIDNITERKDLSHPIHSDNCIIQSDGSCIKAYPAYTQRDYSGILYLNDDFDGGEFIFADSHLHEQSSVRPRCGRLVAFNAGDYHGVRAITKGRRCALAFWFTLSQDFDEQSRHKAMDLISKYNIPKIGSHDEL